MGTVTFLLPDPLPEGAHRCLDQAVLAVGYDQSPVPTLRKIETNYLALTKDATESGYLTTPWPVPDAGTPVCLSATIRERSEPYNLVLELARGKLNQVRNLSAEWESIGMTIDELDRVDLENATRLFGRAVIDPLDKECAILATQVLDLSFRLSERLSRSFAEQLLQTRFAESGKLTTGVGVKISQLPMADEQARITELTNAIRLVPDWRTIEPTEAGYNWDEFDSLVSWAVGTGLQVSIGPLISPTSSLPDWLKEWNGDLPSLAAFTCDFIETVICRYQDRVNTWQIFSGLNHADVLGLGEDDRIRLAARLLDAARQADSQSEWVIGLNQPWGEYLAHEDQTYSPLVFADTLMRAGFTLDAIDLDLTQVGDGKAIHHRDPLEVYRIIELFSVLGVPLEVTVSENQSSTETSFKWVDPGLELAVALPQIRAIFRQNHLNQVPPSALDELRHRFIA